MTDQHLADAVERELGGEHCARCDQRMPMSAMALAGTWHFVDKNVPYYMCTGQYFIDCIDRCGKLRK